MYTLHRLLFLRVLISLWYIPPIPPPPTSSKDQIDIVKFASYIFCQFITEIKWGLLFHLGVNGVPGSKSQYNKAIHNFIIGLKSWYLRTPHTHTNKTHAYTKVSFTTGETLMCLLGYRKCVTKMSSLNLHRYFQHYTPKIYKDYHESQDISNNMIKGKQVNYPLSHILSFSTGIRWPLAYQRASNPSSLGVVRRVLNP